MLLVVVALVPLAVVIDFALLYVNFPNAMELVLLVDVPIIAVVGAGAFLSFRKRKASNKSEPSTPQTASAKMISDAVNHRESKPPRRAANLRESEAEAEEADVFLGGHGVEKSARDVDMILSRMRARDTDTDLGVSPTPGIEPHVHQNTAQVLAEQPTEEMEKQPREREYEMSPEKLKIPAFVCRCGHAHRFVCLTCGMNVETAMKKKNMHWVEWTPDMVANP
jgi:hypothetical protein